MKITTLLSACLIMLGSSAQQSSITMPSVTTTGRAHVYAIPDEVVIEVMLENEDNDLKVASTATDQQSQAVLKVCSDFGIAKEHAQSQYRRYGLNYRYRKDGRPKYRATQSISICLRDLSRYDEFMKKIIALEIASVSGAQFRTSKHREHMDQARAKAIRAAKEKAVALAGELKQHVGRAINIQENTFTQRWGGNAAYANSMSAAESGGSSIAGDSFAPGQLKIEAEISVTFALD